MRTPSNLRPISHVDELWNEGEKKARAPQFPALPRKGEMKFFLVSGTFHHGFDLRIAVSLVSIRSRAHNGAVTVEVISLLFRADLSTHAREILDLKFLTAFSIVRDAFIPLGSLFGAFFHSSNPILVHDVEIRTTTQYKKLANRHIELKSLV